MRGDTSRLPLVLAAFIGGLALFVAGFFIALEVRSVAATPNHAAITASKMADGLTCFNVDADTGLGQSLGDAECASHDAACVGGFAGQCDLERTYDAIVNCSVAQTMGYDCWRCCAVTATAVGGTIELLPSISDSAGHNYAVAAALALVAGVAFAAGGWYARRRWLR